MGPGSFANFAVVCFLEMRVWSYPRDRPDGYSFVHSPCDALVIWGATLMDFMIYPIEDNATIRLLNTHAELSASKQKRPTPKYHTLFYLNDPLSPCSRAPGIFNAYQKGVFDVSYIT